MEEKISDIRMFEILKNLLDLYKKEAEKGRYVLFEPEDVFMLRIKGKIDLESKKNAANINEGLRALGDTVYFIATGTGWKGNRSIRIDGYPRIPVKIWPVLEVMLSGSGNATIEKIEDKMKEVEREIENEKKVSEIIADEDDSKSLIGDLLKAGCGITMVEEGEDNPNKRIEIGDIIVRAPEGKRIFGHRLSESGDGIHIMEPSGAYANYPLEKRGYKISGIEYTEEVRIRRIVKIKEETGKDDSETVAERIREFEKGRSSGASRKEAEVSGIQKQDMSQLNYRELLPVDTRYLDFESWKESRGD